MIKKVICIFLSFAMIFCISSCGNYEENNSEKETFAQVTEPTKKVVIMVAPEGQYPEDYRVAKALEKKYPNTVVVKEYADSRVLVVGSPEIVTLSQEIAEDKNVGAIIYARATQFTYNAIQSVNAVNPDIFTVAIEPESNMSEICSAANLVLVANWKKYSADIIAQAKKQGAENFVFLSFSRHIGSNPLYAQLTSCFETECESEGINYIYRDIEDTNSETASSISENVKATLNYLYNHGEVMGENVAIFSTNSLAQKPIVNYIKERGLIYICPSFPTAYNGIGETYDTEYSNLDSYVKILKSVVESDEENIGRFSIYNYSLINVLETGALYTVFDLLNGKKEMDEVFEVVIERLEEASENDDFTADLAFGGAAVECYAPGFEIIK